jgi:hypothetical protein
VAGRLKTEFGDDIELALTPAPARATRNERSAGTSSRASRSRRPPTNGSWRSWTSSKRSPHPANPLPTLDQVSYLFAWSIERLMLGLFAANDRALSRFGSFRHLYPIAPANWQLGLADRFGRAGCQIDKATLTRIIELGAGHPR